LFGDIENFDPAVILPASFQKNTGRHRRQYDNQYQQQRRSIPAVIFKLLMRFDWDVKYKHRLSMASPRSAPGSVMLQIKE
jgi:hypothetical protein